jgi:hypothetical protein
MTEPRRLTARGRLTLVTVALFVGMSIVLVTVNYLVIRSITEPGTPPPAAEALAELGIEPPSPDADPPAPGALGEGVDLREIFARAQAEARRDLLERLLVSSAVAVGVAALLAWIVAGRVARGALAPVHRITDTARTLSGDSLDQRIDLAGPDDELKELADTFDDMLDRLQASFDARRRFGAYASHELRTPLTTLRAEAELVLHDPDASDESRRLATVALETVQRADRLVGSLLTIGRAEAGVDTATIIDLATVAGDAAADAAETDLNRVRFDLRLDTAEVHGDPSLLLSMAENLIRNAVCYNTPGGLVAVTVSVDARTRHAVLVVENDGQILTAADIESMSQPFRRLSLSRTSGAGHGLGTAIVQAVAEAHHGTATWSARPQGGVVAAVRIPIAHTVTNADEGR